MTCLFLGLGLRYATFAIYVAAHQEEEVCPDDDQLPSGGVGSLDQQDHPYERTSKSKGKNTFLLGMKENLLWLRIL